MVLNFVYLRNKAAKSLFFRVTVCREMGTCITSLTGRLIRIV